MAAYPPIINRKRKASDLNKTLLGAPGAAAAAALPLQAAVAALSMADDEFVARDAAPAAGAGAGAYISAAAQALATAQNARLEKNC